ncbi:MAG TPA: type II toxin-antitoxin system PemK/MazF family toxin [Dehalococcoidia bacterium]|jgi:mRNA interferase MazF|nr:type II toxin-antitoxin system PemK/MazF family toxin [Dehalococcoidia bacterium]
MTIARGFPKYGDIYETQLDPVVGAETAKRRPALIVSNNENNEFAQTVTILPLTGRAAQRSYPFEVQVPRGTGGLRLTSRVKANQIRTVDKSRLIRHVGQLPAEYMTQVRDAIRVHLNLR